MAHILTLLMLLTRMIGLSDVARAEAREVVFPAAKYAKEVLASTTKQHDAVQQPYADEDTRANRLIALLSNANAGVCQTTQQFLFQLCDSDKDEFTRLVGFGSAAGFLAMRGFSKCLKIH